MSFLLETAIKISLVTGLGLVAVMLLRRGSAALRHWMLAAAMLTALATPLLTGLAPSWSLPVAAATDPGTGRRHAHRPLRRSRLARSGDARRCWPIPGHPLNRRPSTRRPRSSRFGWPAWPSTWVDCSWVLASPPRRRPRRAVHDGPWVDARARSPRSSAFVVPCACCRAINQRCS